MKWRRFSPEAQNLKVYGYWRSSATWRLRWALTLKEIPFEYIPINLLKNENKLSEHLARSPLGTVPVLEINEGNYITQSMAAMEWIEEVYQLKGPALFPGTPIERAYVRQLCEIINSDTAPLQTPRAQKRHSANADQQKEWAQDFISAGLRAYDVQSRALRKSFSVYDTVSAADLYLIPQIYNALRYEVKVAQDYPDLLKIFERCLKTEACYKASPEQQIDAIKDS